MTQAQAFAKTQNRPRPTFSVIMYLSALKCPYYAVGCQLDSSTKAPYDECCVSNNGIAIFAQNYTYGLSYRYPSNNWTDLSVVRDIGPKFTVHGLWPNKCDGSFNQTQWNSDHTQVIGHDYDLYGCDASRSFQNAEEILQNTTGKFRWIYPLIKEIWRAGDGDDNWFYSHEWSKHGTCAESFKPRCYEDKFTPFLDFYEYLSAVVELYVRLDVKKAFRAVGIDSSDKRGYNRTLLNDAHAKMFGHPGGMQCVQREGKFYLSEVWTYLQERPGHAFTVASPDIVTKEGGAYQSCPLDQLVYIPLTPFVEATGEVVGLVAQEDD
ncbi:ribonuclease T2-like [Podochytrium sp. JEL0797]|nr:ribonuclease T2-like [Podochytrium sp. JEL0797]